MSEDQYGTWEKLSQVAVKGAQYNSRERQPHPKCLEGTRVDLLKYIYGFLDDREKNQLIWLHGTAGVGKSAVAFTVSERLKSLKVREQVINEKRLAGSFFFSRKHTKRCTAGYFFVTLVYQLANNFPSIREDVNKAIRENPALLDPDTPLCDQMDALFLEPLRRLRFRLRDCPPLTFVVDALDECTSEPELTDLILSLAQALREPGLPVTHILLTSRSESHISKAFHNDGVRPLLCEIPVKTSGEGIGTIISLDGADVDSDIYIFLQHSFAELASRHPDFPQPPKDQLARLASRAGRRFIVASTMMKFIIDDEDKDPRDQLQLMLELTSGLLPGTDVYKLYDRILSTCADPKRAYLHLSVVAALTDPLPISQISTLLGPGLGRDVETTLIQLRSVINIPTNSTLPVDIYHSSIRDYVSDPSNCSLPQVRDITSPHSLLAHSSLRLMTEITASTALSDALAELKKQSNAMQAEDHHSLKDSLAFLVQPLEPLSVLICMLWLRGDRTSNLQFWLGTMDGRAWLQTRDGKDWLQTQGGRDWLQTRAGRDWLQTQAGRDWVQTQAGRDWVQTQAGRDWVQTQAGRDWLQTQAGRDWVQTQAGRDWVLTQAGRDLLLTQAARDWLQTHGGRDWLQTQAGRDWLQTQAGRVWLQTEGGRDWLLAEGGRDWLQTQAGRDWVQTQAGQDRVQTQAGQDRVRTQAGRDRVRTQAGRAWLRTQAGRDWLRTQAGRDWLRTHGGRDWLRTQGGRDWVQTQGGRDWLRTQGGRDWVQTQGGRDLLQTQGGRDWLQTQAGRDWLQTQGGQDWLQIQGGRHWLQTEGGRYWLQTEGGRDWLQTQAGRVWLQTHGGRDWLQVEGGRGQVQIEGGRGRVQTETEGGRDWLRTEGGRDWLRAERGRDWLRTEGGRDWLRTEGGQDWVQTQVGRDWVQTQGGRDWLQTQGGRDWLQIQGGRDWLQTQGGHIWLQTQAGRRWLQTQAGRDWLQTEGGRGWLWTEGGRDWLQIQGGRDWLQTRAGRVWLQTEGGRHWVQTHGGRDWLQIEEGRDWLQTEGGRDWLQTEGGRVWLQVQGGRVWLQTQGGYTWLKTMDGRDWLQTEGGRDWLQIRGGRDWLWTEGGRDWLQIQGGRDWLQTQGGRVWLQTPHGQAWQSTPAASVWVIMEEFSNTLEAITEYISVQELPLPPPFQVVQQFNSLPDFLMFPMFLALMPRNHLNSALPEVHFPHDREIIHAMNAFTAFANEAQERSQSISDALKYASQNWVVHLSCAPNPWGDTLNRIFQAFWNCHLLSWLERQWCLKGLRSCLDILSKGQKFAKFEPVNAQPDEGLPAIAPDLRRSTTEASAFASTSEMSTRGSSTPATTLLTEELVVISHARPVPNHRPSNKHHPSTSSLAPPLPVPSLRPNTAAFYVGTSKKRMLDEFQINSNCPLESNTPGPSKRRK